MAKSEIPSIIVHRGGGNSSSNGVTNNCHGCDMEQHQSTRPSRLEKQNEIELEEEGCVPSPVMIQIEDGGGGLEEHPDEAAGGQNGCAFESTEDIMSSDGGDAATTSSPTSGQSTDHSGEETRKEKKASSHRVKLLVRSQAVHDDASPPPDLDTVSTNTNMLSVTNAPSFTTQSQTKSSNKNRLGRQGSSQGSTESSSASGLSRDSSTETYTDSTGIDLQQFIIDTLHKNQKDRMMLLKIEQDLINLVKDNKRQSQKFPQMSSYNRMLVHRVSAFFGMDHYVDPSGTAVLVNKTKNTRIPDSRFQDHIRDELLPEEPKKSILKRDSVSFEETKERSPERQCSSDNRRSKSFEEREEEYEKARARIFNQDNIPRTFNEKGLTYSSGHMELSYIAENKGLAETYMANLVTEKEGFGDSPLNRSQEGTHSSSRRSSQEDIRWGSGETRPWSSTDSDSSGRPQISKCGSSGDDGNGAAATSKNGRNVAVLTKADSDSKELLIPIRSGRPAVTKASSFGGISVLTRDTQSGKGITPKITKAESFNATTISSSHPSPTGLGPPPVQSQASVISSSPIHVPSTSILQCTSTNQYPVSSATVQQTFPMVAGQPTHLQLQPVQQASSQPIPGWCTVSKESLPSDYSPHTPVGQHLMWPLSSGADSLLPGSMVISPQTGTPYINMDSTIYRYKQPVSATGQAIMLTPFQQVAVPASSQVPVASHLPAGPALSTTQPQAQQQSLQSSQLQQIQQQQPQQAMPATPAIVYIPYVPSPVQASIVPQAPLSQMPGVPQQQTQLLSDQRQFALDPNGTGVGELVAQMSNVSFVSTHLSGQSQSQDATTGRVVSVESTPPPAAVPPPPPPAAAVPPPPPQSYIIPTFKSQGFISQPGNVTQFPVYYMQQVPQASSIHPVRYVFPATAPAQSAAQNSVNSIGIGGQNIPDLQTHVVTQSSSQIAGPQYLPGYSVLALSQSGDTALPNSFVSYSVSSQTSGVSTSTTSVLVPSSGMSVPIYPYANMVISNVSNGNQALAAASTTSQPSQATAYVPTPLAIQTPAALPMYVVTTTSTQTPITQTHISSNVSSQYASFRSQSLPPAQSCSSPATGNQQQLSVGSPFVGYTVYTPPLQSSGAQQSPAPVNQSSHAQSSPPQFAPAFMTTFQVLRPSIPVVGNLRTSTPPPQNVIPPQFPTPPSSASKVPLSFPLVKQASDPGGGAVAVAGDCFGVGSVGGRTDQQKASRASQLQVGAPAVCPSAGNLMCRRGIPIVQDLCLIGHPLQQHLSTLVLPQQRQIPRFPHPSTTGSSSSNRPQKVRKQRNRGGNCSTGSSNSSSRNNIGTGSSQPPREIAGPTTGIVVQCLMMVYKKLCIQPSKFPSSVCGNHILEVEGLPEGMKRSEVERYLEQVTSHGAKIQFLNSETGGLTHIGPDFVMSSRHVVLAVFESDTAAQSALLSIKTSKFQLRQLRRGGKDGSLKTLS